jgi:hypothetical protein
LLACFGTGTDMETGKQLQDVVNQAIELALTYGSDEEVRAKRESLERKKTISFNAVCTAIVAWGLLVIGTLISLKWMDPANVAVSLLVLMTFPGFALGPVVRHLSGAEADEIISRYQPLSESSDCFSALRLVEHSAAASSLRDSVLAMGRQLYVFDYELMRQLDRAEDETEEALRASAEKQRQACAQLHRLT